ncbi:MAG: carboxypeptidase-like regulatory domain-containing protein, partial [Rhodothermales bacterium]|nr:carboxypeptidase-like regulatory domain-containing protein [Rhodothermales bacterium]
MRGAIATILILAAALAPRTQAQEIRVSAGAENLRAVLEAVGLQAGVDIVFSHALVEGRKVTCQYEGARIEDALGCVLVDAGLDYEQVGPRQFVIRIPLTADPPNRHRLTGRIVDSASGSPLTGAHVHLPGSARGAVAARDGSFEVDGLPRAQHRVRTSFVGYATVDTLVNIPGNDLQIELEPVGIGTETLVVVGDARTPDVALALPGVVSLDVGDLQEIPTSLDDQDLFQALEWLPGIERSGETIGGLSVRGSSPDLNRYLLEGAPVYHPSHAFSLIS